MKFPLLTSVCALFIAAHARRRPHTNRISQPYQETSLVETDLNAAANIAVSTAMSTNYSTNLPFESALSMDMLFFQFEISETLSLASQSRFCGYYRGILW